MTRDCFDGSANYPIGTDEYAALHKWYPWIEECVLFLDGKGTFRHFKYSGSYSEQPYIDIAIYRIIQRVWVEKQNEKLQKQ